MLIDSVLTFSIFAVAAPAAKPVCDAMAVTRNCEYFKENSSKQMIELPNGSRFKNPLYSPLVSLSGKADSSNFGYYQEATGYGGFSSAQMEEAVHLQAGIMDVLEGTGVSSEFKITFGATAAAMLASPTGQFSVPWPLDQKKAKLSQISGKEILESLKKKIGSQKFAELKNILRDPAAQYAKSIQEVEKKRQESERKNKEWEQQRAEIHRQANEKIQKRKDRVKEIFTWTKEQAINMIRRGRSDQQLNHGERAAVKKIEDITLARFDNPSLIESTSCANGASNAFYSKDNTINICPGILHETDAYLAFVIGHEIGHSVDPCNFQMPKYAIDQTKLRQFSQKRKFDNQSTARLKSLSGYGNGQFHMDPRIVFEPKLADELIREGILTLEKKGELVEDYPFKKEYECLTGPNMFRETTPEDIAYSKSYLKRLMGQAPDQNDIDTVKNYERLLEQYPQCIRTPGHSSQTGEVMSDVFGSVIFEKYISMNPFRNEDEKVGAIPWSHARCSPDAPKFERLDPLTVGLYFPIVAGEHPADGSRISKLTFNLPGTAEAYGCQRKEKACFDRLSLVDRITIQSGSAPKAKSPEGVQ